MITWQPSLLGAGPPAVGACSGQPRRTVLDTTSWVDYQQGWVSGADQLFADLVVGTTWGQRRRHMYDRVLDEPRLTARWLAEAGEPLRPATLETARRLLSDRYGVTFDSVGLNFYRDGRDSVAWHRDRIPAEIPDPVVALVSLGEPRRFLLRPPGGGRSLAFLLGHGDLLVTGGQTQRRWEHAVPKVASAGPRISLAFRHGA